MALPQMPKKSIILCATQRCGSTMICEDMRNTKILGMPEEHFLPWDISKPISNWEPHLEGVYRRGSSENGVFAVKIMANQLARVDTCLATIVEPQVGNADKAFPHLRTLFKDATWIWLKREDVARQAISREMAAQTGVNHATRKSGDEHFAGNTLKGYDKDYNVHTSFNEHAIAAKITTIMEENLTWLRFFHDWGMSPLTLHYEENCRDFPGYLYKLAHEAGIELPPDIPARKMVRLSNAVNDAWFEAYTDRLVGKA